MPAWVGALRSGLVTLAGLWPLWLPLLAGGAAIFLLLPRPRAYPALWGALAGVLALLLAGGLLVRVGALTPETVLFYAFSAIAVVSGALLVTQQNPARAALSFALVVLSTCGLFLLLAAPFLMAATIIIYAGAIIVTFLFVLMLAQQEGLSDADARSREPLLATLTGFILLAALLYVLRGSYGGGEIDKLLAQTRQASQEADALIAEFREEKERIDKLPAEQKEKETEALLEKMDNERNRIFDSGGANDLYKQYDKVFKANGFNDLEGDMLKVQETTMPPIGPDVNKAEYWKAQLTKLEALALKARGRLGTLKVDPNLPLSPTSGPPPSTPPGELRRDPKTGEPQLPAENSAYLGRSLFTDYLLPVELGGTLLLVATIGAIAIAHRRGREQRRTLPQDGPATERPR
jgi:NADH:ubiquinone oxidoreductase subunit 6 (subunit J)